MSIDLISTKNKQNFGDRLTLKPSAEDFTIIKGTDAILEKVETKRNEKKFIIVDFCSYIYSSSMIL